MKGLFFNNKSIRGVFLGSSIARIQIEESTYKNKGHVNVLPTAKVLAYNGSALELCNAGSGTGTILYSLDGTSYSSSIPSLTVAGSYTVYYKSQESNFYTESPVYTLNCSINEKLVNATIELSEDAYTYDGTAKTPTVTIKDDATTIDPLEYTVTYSNNTNAGTGTVTISDNVGGNYEVVGSVATFTINKADQSAPTATGATVDYSSTATATASGGGGQGLLEWSNGNTRTTAGSQLTSARWSGNSNYNTSPWSNSIILTVVPSDYVEIGGIKWATMNIGANSITDTGLYFQWGDTQGYTAAQVGSDKQFTWNDYKYTNDGGSTMTKYNNTTDRLITLQASDDAVIVAWGGNWRMPTANEFQALGTATTLAWTDDYQGSGVAGLVFTSKSNGATLFFPACGDVYSGNVEYVGYYGNYWSRSLASNDSRAKILGFSSYGIDHWDLYRFCGVPVRGVLAEN